MDYCNNSELTCRAIDGDVKKFKKLLYKKTHFCGIYVLAIKNRVDIFAAFGYASQYGNVEIVKSIINSLTEDIFVILVNSNYYLYALKHTTSLEIFKFISEKAFTCKSVNKLQDLFSLNVLLEVCLNNRVVEIVIIGLIMCMIRK